MFGATSLNFLIICGTLIDGSACSENDNKPAVLENVDLSVFKGLSEKGFLGRASRMIQNSYFDMRNRSGFIPTKQECEARTIKIGFPTYYMSMHPRGKCAFCCPVKNFKTYVKLHWTSKARGGKLTQLKWNYKEGKLREQGFKTELPTVVFAHGFTQSGNDYHANLIRDAYLSRPEEYNQIFVSWSELASFPWYINSLNNTKFVATMVAKYLNFYIKTAEINLDTLHLVGFSLGAHIMGMIGKKIKNIPRITGLDPALPLYEFNDTSNRLTKTDAIFVDIIHTNPGVFGFPISLGHADFYLNLKKKDQPGCTFNELSEFRSVELLIFCNHFRAVNYYSESVRNPHAFPATHCNFNNYDVSGARRCRITWDAYMGFAATKNTTSGDYFLNTNNREPYGRTISKQMAEIRLQNSRIKLDSERQF